jgi:hypothetical protein
MSSYDGSNKRKYVQEDPINLLYVLVVVGAMKQRSVGCTLQNKKLHLPNFYSC